MKTGNKQSKEAKNSGSLRSKLKEAKIEAQKPLYLIRYE